MGTARIIEAVVGDLQANHGLSADNMLLHNFVDVRRENVAVPNGFGIDDDGWTVFALVEAAGLVGTNGGACRSLAETGLEGALQLACAGRVATAAWVVFGSLVTANEDVASEFCHGFSFREAAEAIKKRVARGDPPVFNDRCYRVDSISKPQASRSGSGMYFEFLFLRAHSRSRVDRMY